MFATRTLARAPVAGRLAGSVSTLRVASLSAFTSGSKLAGFFGRASGQSGAPAFQQLGLRMSLCRAFSSQPPIPAPTEADLPIILGSYQLKQFHIDFQDVTKDLHALVSSQTRTIKSTEEGQPDKEILSPNTLLAVMLQLLTLSHLRWVGFTEKTRDYRLQHILKDINEYETALNTTFDALAISQELSLDDLLAHYKLQREPFLESLNYHASTDKEFFEMYNRIMSQHPRVKPGKKYVEPTEPQAIEMLDRLIRYATELTHDPKDITMRDNFRKNYTTDRYYLEHKIDINDYDLREEKMTGAAKEKLLEFRAALIIAH